jgi:acetyl-CoA synthetase
MVEEVAEAAAVPVIDDVRGRAVEMDVALKPGLHRQPGDRGEGPDGNRDPHRQDRAAGDIWIVPDMPKTRSGKIMRRVIAATSNFADVGDITTLANPEAVDQIRHQVQAAMRGHGDAPRELTEAQLVALKAFGAE